MNDFFNGDATQPIEMFGLTHILLLLFFVVSCIVLWYFSPNIRDSKYEKVYRYILVALVFLFEWRVFEGRILNTSLFRMPLCAIAIYTLTYAIAIKNEKVFKVVYFYAFGSLLSYLFFDTPWGLDRWGGWTFFGAHITIAWMAVYGINVFGFVPKTKDLLYSMGALAIYAFIAGYATVKHGGSDELFLITPPIAELNALVDIHQVVYTGLFVLAAAVFILIMYGFTKLHFRNETHT